MMQHPPRVCSTACCLQCPRAWRVHPGGGGGTPDESWGSAPPTLMLLGSTMTTQSRDTARDTGGAQHAPQVFSAGMSALCTPQHTAPQMHSASRSMVLWVLEAQRAPQEGHRPLDGGRQEKELAEAGKVAG